VLTANIDFFYKTGGGEFTKIKLLFSKKKENWAQNMNFNNSSSSRHHSSQI
jgi:hypothetical protein